MFDNALTTLKIIIFGSSGVGKTSILTQLVDSKFAETKATISPDLLTKKYNFDGKIVNLALWDTAGQERFHSLPSNLYRGAQGAVLVYDVTNYKSFRELHEWMSNLEDYYDGSENHPVVIILGNKIDRVGKIENNFFTAAIKSVTDYDGREVQRHEGLTFAKRHRALFLETSAKINSGIDTAFDDLVTKIMDTPGLWKSNINNRSVVNFKQTESSSRGWYSNCGQC